MGLIDSLLGLVGEIADPFRAKTHEKKTKKKSKCGKQGLVAPLFLIPRCSCYQIKCRAGCLLSNAGCLRALAIILTKLEQFFQTNYKKYEKKT